MLIAQCTSIKTNGQRCKVSVTYPDLVCHIHNPDGKFQKQQRGESTCDHRYFMRDEGIKCIDCGDIWQSENTNK